MLNQAGMQSVLHNLTRAKGAHFEGKALMAGWLLYCSCSSCTGQPALASRSNRLCASSEASAALLSTVGGSWQGSPTRTTRPEPAAGVKTSRKQAASVNEDPGCVIAASSYMRPAGTRRCSTTQLHFSMVWCSAGRYSTARLFEQGSAPQGSQKLLSVSAGVP